MDKNQADEDELPASEATQERSKCEHHWVLDPPAGGPVTNGVCRNCGEERDFPTYTEPTWNNQRKNS